MDAKALEEIRTELVRLLHSSATPLASRAAALTRLRAMNVDVLAELKSLDPKVAAEIATEAVLLQDESGTLLDALTKANVGEDESDPEL
ncbi:MAG TPA: hypothetical protein VE974_23575 [Thermoanaerobaculia bacterium]|nr:hypothetical protein [Thermoanaerobaculia bacterium]